MIDFFFLIVGGQIDDASSFSFLFLFFAHTPLVVVVFVVSPNKKNTEPSTSASNADDSSSNKEKKKEKPRTRIRKPPRAVAGSWETCAELDDFFASDAAHRVPAGANLYDLRSTFPYHFDDSRRNVPLFAAVAEAAAESGVDLEAEDEDDGKHEGRKRIVEWETNAVLETVAAEVGGGGGGGGISQSQHQHPMNRKVGLRVHLADLAAETGLSDAGARWVALIAGPRYDPRTGKLRLTDERHATRRENARSCARMLSALVAEGKRKHPS